MYNSDPSSSVPGSNNNQDNIFQGWKVGSQQEQLLNMGMGMGAQMVQTGLAKYLPGAYVFWEQLKFYFAVNNKYVVQKLGVLLCPFRRKPEDWCRMLGEEVALTPSSSQHGPRESQPQQTTSSHKYAKPWADLNCPDLYIPLMAFITFVMATGYSKGRSHKFTPQTLVDVTSQCFVVEIMETLLLRLGVYMLQAPGSFFELGAFSSYKYVGLCISQIGGLFLQGWPFYLLLLYLGSAMTYFMLKSMANNVPHLSPGSGMNKELAVLAFSALHFVTFLWIGFFM